MSSSARLYVPSVGLFRAIPGPPCALSALRVPPRQPIQTRRRIIQRPVEQPRIHIERHRRRRVPQLPLNGLHIRACRDGERGIGVSQVVHPQSVQSGTLDRPIHRLAVDPVRAPDPLP